MTARPSRCSASPTASTVGRTTADACVMEGGWVSSKSRPCASAPLATIASGADAVRSVPTTVHGPCSRATTASTARAKSAREAASARPRVSSTRSRTLSTTSVGSASNRNAAAKLASLSAIVAVPVATALFPGRAVGGLAKAVAGSALLLRAFFLPGEGDVAVALAGAEGNHLAAFGRGDRDLLDQAGVEHLLDERLALVSGRRQLMRLRAHHEVAAAHMRQPGFRPLELGDAALERFLGAHTLRHPRQRRPREPAQRDGAPLALGHARTLDPERADALAQVDVSEAPHPQIGRELLGRPRGDPDLLAEGVDSLHRGHEVVVARDEHRRVVGAVGRVVNEVGHQPGVDALLGRVLVLAAAHVTAPGPAHARLPLHEVAGAKLEALEERLDERRRPRRDADVVVRAAEHRAATADLLCDPGGQTIVVDAKGLVVAEERAIEVLTVKENADLHARLPGRNRFRTKDPVVGEILPWPARSRNRRLVAARVSLAVHPAHLDLVARLAARERELQKRILRHGGSPLRREHGPAVMAGAHLTDEVRGHELAVRVLALTGLHLVRHQDAHQHLVALHARA